MWFTQSHYYMQELFIQECWNDFLYKMYIYMNYILFNSNSTVCPTFEIDYYSHVMMDWNQFQTWGIWYVLSWIIYNINLVNKIKKTIITPTEKMIKSIACKDIHVHIHLKIYLFTLGVFFIICFIDVKIDFIVLLKYVYLKFKVD